ncbi:hypothetical protein [Terriglobus sp.]|uniref:hypothetical protein n=1 Tax=Terriglobus sp. TaxID=1889013 RepID=UPI003B00A083
MDLTSWIGMVRMDASMEIEAADLREILLNLMNTVPLGSAEYANLDFLQQHFKHACECPPATSRFTNRIAATKKKIAAGKEFLNPLPPG